MVVESGIIIVGFVAELIIEDVAPGIKYFVCFEWCLTQRRRFSDNCS